MFLTVLIMSWVFRIEIVARGQGKVIPVTRVQVVQPEFTGQIRKIFVEDGSLVEKGELLIELDVTEVQAEINKLELEVDHLQVERMRVSQILELLANPMLKENHRDTSERIQFEVNGNPLDASYVEEQQLLMNAEIQAIRDRLIQFAERINANRSAESVIRSEISRIDSAQKAQRKRLEIADDLVPKGAISQSGHLDIQEKYDNLKLEKNVSYQELQQIRTQENSILAERTSYLSSQTRAYFERRTQIESAISILEQNLKKNQHIKSSRYLRSPVDGYVNQLVVFTIGGLAIAGEELLNVVPSDSQIAVEAVFTNADVGFLKVGQKANVRFDAFPSERFGFVNGTVNYVSADAEQIVTDEWGYKVKIRLASPHLETKSEKHSLRPGMTATVDVITGDRKVISYFFAPILKTLQDSMGER